MLYLSAVVAEGRVVALHSAVVHVGLRCRAEHIGQVKVNRLVSTCLLEGQVHILGRLSDDVHRSTLTLCDTCDTL